MIAHTGAARCLLPVGLGCALALAAVAATPAPGFGMVVPPEWVSPPPKPAAPPQRQAPPAVPGDIVPWDRLTELGVEYEAPVPGQTTIRIVFSDAIEILDGEEIKFRGFMHPIDGGARHKRFLLSALPPHCPFCLPTGPAQMIEVLCEEPVAFTYEPMVVAGRFELLRDDPSGLYYRLHDASSIDE